MILLFIANLFDSMVHVKTLNHVFIILKGVVEMFS